MYAKLVRASCLGFEDDTHRPVVAIALTVVIVYNPVAGNGLMAVCEVYHLKRVLLVVGSQWQRDDTLVLCRPCFKKGYVLLVYFPLLKGLLHQGQRCGVFGKKKYARGVHV